VSRMIKAKNEVYIIVDEVFRNLAFITIIVLLIKLLFSFTLPFDFRTIIIPLAVFGVARLCLK